MKVDCITEYGEEQYNKGLKEGMKIGTEIGRKIGTENGREQCIQIIENYLNKNIITPKIAAKELISLNCKTKTITKITGLNEKEIENLFLNEQNHN